MRDKILSVLDAYAAGLPVKRAVEEIGMPWSTFWRETCRDPVLAREYAAARVARTEILAAETTDIADSDDNPHRARNRIQARQWLAERMNPASFGQRLDVAVSQTVDLRDAIEARKTRALAMRAALAEPGRNLGPPIEMQAIDVSTQIALETTDYKSVDRTKASDDIGLFDE